MAKRVEMAKTLPGARRAVLASGAGAQSAHVVMLPDGSGPRRYVSVGMLGRTPDISAFRVAAPVGIFVISEEPTACAQVPGTMILQGSMV